MKEHDYRTQDLIKKTVIPILLLWTVILYFAFYKPYAKSPNLTMSYGISNKLYLVLLFPFVWAITTIHGVLNDEKGQGLILDRPACINIDVPKSLKKLGFVSLYKPACRSTQQQLAYDEASSINRTSNYILNILFLLILIFISVKSRKMGHMRNRVTKTTSVLVFILLLGSLSSSGFIVFPWRALVFTRMSVGLTVCAASLLTFMVFGIFPHIYA